MDELPFERIAALAAVVAAMLAGLAVLILLIRRGGPDPAAIGRDLATLDHSLRREISHGMRDAVSAAVDQLSKGLAAQSDGLERFDRSQREAIAAAMVQAADRQSARLDAVDRTLLDGHAAVQAVLSSFKTQVSDSLDHARILSEASLQAFAVRLEAQDATLKFQLDEIRKVVDERLQSALEKQLKDSFANLQEQLGAVQQAIGQVQSVAGEVGDLKRLFSNVKSRGGWGEAQLEAMLTDMLHVGAFQKNFRVKEDSAEVVEFALRVPGRAGAHAWLAIDSKFPTEDYARLLAAHEVGDGPEEAAARTALSARMRLEARKIGSKYILAPLTLDFAIIYLPSDSLFAEIARVPGLIEQIRAEHRVMVVGPSLLPAFLHTLRVSYASISLEARVSEVARTLEAVKAEWGRFGEALSVIDKQAATLTRGIKSTLVRQRAVERQLHAGALLEEEAEE